MPHEIYNFIEAKSCFYLFLDTLVNKFHDSTEILPYSRILEAIVNLKDCIICVDYSITMHSILTVVVWQHLSNLKASISMRI